MKEIYSWVPWFRELARKIAEGGEAYLIEKAKQVKWGGDPPLLRYGDEGIDPFSFFYFLASKSTKNQQEQVYNSVSREFEIKIPLPDMRIEDYYLFPIGYRRFHDGTNFYPDLLWRLFREAEKDNPNIDLDFKKALDLDIKDIGVAEWTQTLFLINPNYFLPVENPTKLPVENPTKVLSEALGLPALRKIEKEIKNGGYEKYLSVLKKIKKAFPECQPYEINMFLYLQKAKEIINAESKFFQIDTKIDRSYYWRDFKKNNWVYTGGPGSGKTWGEEVYDRKYHLEKPGRGDIILVKTGKQKGRAIGIVQKNDYAESGLNENSRIHVLWINKSTCDLSGHTDERKFREAKPGGKTYLAFEKTDGYKPSFHLINSLTGNSIKNGPEPDIDELPKPDTSDILEQSHFLNQILYGPPGTGKTWNTVNYAMAIIEGKSLDELEGEGREEIKERFDTLKEEGQIAMVTFHQNFTYEDFIEGIRPVLDDGDRDIEYELHKGVFREIADHARENRDQNYVLIIDEINRGNIAKIFAELITLIEPSKRIGSKKDETTVTLPYSKEEFGVPNNLYIIGTMNTADRSIAPLDTALRRRFEFIEMMPDSKHDRISTDIEGVDCQELLAAMNDRIRFLLDREHQIGHTYFMDVNNLESLAATFKNQIIPLLQEYFYDNWEKIDLVLNRNGFIVPQSSIDSNLFKNSELIDEERKIYELLPDNDDKWTDPKSYREIYQQEQGETDEAGQDT